MTIPGGIRVKLSLALLVIVGSALFAAYVIIVPSLERRLVAAKLDQQQSDAEILAINSRPRPRRTTSRFGDFVDVAGFISNSRVVVFGVGGSPGSRTLSRSQIRPRRWLGDRKATRLRSRRPER